MTVPNNNIANPTGTKPNQSVASTVLSAIWIKPTTKPTRLARRPIHTEITPSRCIFPEPLGASDSPIVSIPKRYRKPLFGGGKRDRTADLLHAMQALSQLSYTPERLAIIRIEGLFVKFVNSAYLPHCWSWCCMRRSTSSRPINSNVASMEGVWVSPVTITRKGIAILPILRPCVVAVFFKVS